MHSSILINFRIPKDLKASFDIVCMCRNVTRTHVLNRFIHDYVQKTAAELLEERRQLDRFKNFLSQSIPHSTISNSKTGLNKGRNSRDLMEFDEENLPIEFWMDDGL